MKYSNKTEWSKAEDRRLRLVFADRIKEERIKLGINRAELASKMGIDSHAVGRLERGSLRVTLAHIMQVAQALDVEPKDLLTSSRIFKCVLHCPYCFARHIDQGTLALVPHTKHKCKVCGFQWKVDPLCVGVSDADLIVPPLRTK